MTVILHWDQPTTGLVDVVARTHARTRAHAHAHAHTHTLSSVNFNTKEHNAFHILGG